MRLNSGPGSVSGVNEGLVSLSNLDASFQFSFTIFFALFLASDSLFASRNMESQDSHMRSTKLVPICSLPERSQPFVGPLAFPDMISSRLGLGGFYLCFRDPNRFRASMIHSSLPLCIS